MIDGRFSDEAFELCGLDTKEARELADKLEQEIQNEMHEVVWAAFQTIVQKLNSMGHRLKPYGEQTPGDTSFRDDYETDSGYHCKLRVGLDVIVSTGYAHVTSPSELEREDENE